MQPDEYSLDCHAMGMGYRSFQEMRNAHAAERAAQREDCPHQDHEHGVCIECGADITDELVSRAEAAADAREDRRPSPTSSPKSKRRRTQRRKGR